MRGGCASPVPAHIGLLYRRGGIHGIVTMAMAVFFAKSSLRGGGSHLLVRLRGLHFSSESQQMLCEIRKCSLHGLQKLCTYGLSLGLTTSRELLLHIHYLFSQGSKRLVCAGCLGRAYVHVPLMTRMCTCTRYQHLCCQPEWSCSDPL